MVRLVPLPGVAVVAAGAFAVAVAIAPAVPSLHAQPLAAGSTTRVLDSFSPLRGWVAAPSDGVTLRISQGEGARGGAMRLDFDFNGRGGYAIARKAFDIPLPANYAFSFRLRGRAPVENLEFKLVDSTGDNVWWRVQRDVRFPAQWRTVEIERREIEFAWGPRGGVQLDRAASLEIVITAGSGGRGTVWIDELTFTPLPPEHPYTRTPRVTATSAAPGAAAALALDGDTATAWRSAARAGAQRLTADFLERREFAGATVDWLLGRFATRYVVETSADGARWDSVYAVTGGNGGRDFIYLPDTRARWLRLRLLASASGRGYGIREIGIMPASWSASPDSLFAALARAAPRGRYPRYFLGEQAYWTVVGVNGDGRTALLDADGTLEPFAGGFSIEPFLRVEGAGGASSERAVTRDTAPAAPCDSASAGAHDTARAAPRDTAALLTWADVRARQWLEGDALPIPSVQWSGAPLSLTITAFAAGERGRSALLARYRVRNGTARPQRATLYLAVRPFQVNPPWQTLATPGGLAPVARLAYTGGAVRVNGSRTIVPLTAPSAFGAATFDQGGIVGALRSGSLPARRAIRDSAPAWGAGALAYALTLAPGATRDIWLEVPFYPGITPAPPSPTSPARASAYGERRLAATRRTWEQLLGRATIELPPAGARVTQTLRAALADILIARDGPALRPGTRSYARSWIRDGVMMSAALLRLGHPEEVRAFLEWYAPYQFPSGKVPCCVDARGADPVPENDSHGELIYGVAEYWRFTGDTAFLARMWPTISRAVGYIDSLRAQRSTAVYASGDSAAYHGLVPQSISHEGYSAKPMHSYWDDLWTLRGLKDAVAIAAALGRDSARVRWTAARDTVRADLYRSMRLAMAARGIAYIPGSVELGDFDPTSTTIAVAPGGELGRIPEAPLRRTFERYWRFTQARQRGDTAWEAYTPYELRAVGTFVRLGWPARALALLDFFFAGQRPAGWRQWAEVVWRDPAAPMFIGDMPHAWIASDYIRSVLDMVAYAREADSALVVGAGLDSAWLAQPPGVRVRGLRTPYGALGATFLLRGDTLEATLGGEMRVPRGGVVVRSPLGRPPRAATVDGAPAPVSPAGEVVVRRLPAAVRVVY